jgi:hypothetical protein
VQRCQLRAGRQSHVLMPPFCGQKAGRLGERAGILNVVPAPPHPALQAESRHVLSAPIHLARHGYRFLVWLEGGRSNWSIPDHQNRASAAAMLAADIWVSQQPASQQDGGHVARPGQMLGDVGTMQLPGR